jgi:hypothetical protein
MLFLNLPIDILRKILLFLQCPISKLIKDEIDIYEKDHNWVYTKMYKKYYIKNIMSFNCYYFDKMIDPFDYESFQNQKYSNDDK